MTHLCQHMYQGEGGSYFDTGRYFTKIEFLLLMLVEKNSIAQSSSINACISVEQLWKTMTYKKNQRRML